MFTAQPAGQLPVVLTTLVTADSEHVRQTDALAAVRVARSRAAIGAQNVADARYTRTHTLCWRRGFVVVSRAFHTHTHTHTPV